MQIECPQCRAIDYTSDDAGGETRCGECGHVWTPPRPEPRSAERSGSPAPVRRVHRSRGAGTRTSRARSSFGIGDSVGKAFSVWASNFVPFTLMAYVVFAPVLAYRAARAFGIIGYSESLIVLGAEMFVPLAFQQLLSAALIYGVFQKLRKQPASIGDSIGRGFSCLLPVIGVALMYLLIMVVAMGPGLLMIATENPLLALIGGIITMIAFVYVGCALIVAVPAAVVERLGVIDAIKRSWNLTKGRRGTVFVTLAIFGIMMILLGIPLTLIVGLVMFTIDDLTLSEFLVELLTVPFNAITAAVIAVMYHNLRVSREGIDTEQLAKIFD